jgi:origin recognition complex subunit 6
MMLREDAELAKKIQKKAKEEDMWEGWEKIGTKDVDSWLIQIPSRGWLELDWFENIVEGAGLEVKDGLGQNGHSVDAVLESMAEGGGVAKDVLQAGLGTMMQDRVNYLSERKRAEYKIWKEGIMARIEEIEAEGVDAMMDVSEG